MFCPSLDVRVELDSVEAELESVELQIARLVQKQAELTTRRDALLQQVEEACDAAQPSSSSSSSSKSARSNPGLSKQETKHYDGTGTGQTWLCDHFIHNVMTCF